MPFTRSSRKPQAKKSTYRRRSSYRRPTASFATRVKAVVAKQSETKFNIKSLTESGVYGTTLTSPTNYTILNALNEGFTENQRVGNKVAPMLLNIRGSVQSNSLNPILTRLLIVETNSANDPRNDLLEDNTGAVNPATSDLYAISARINTTKYKVLKQIVLKTGTYANHVGDFGGTQLFNETIKLKGVMEYEDGQTNCNKRSIVLVPIFREAQNDTTGGQVVELTWNSKFYYKDM